MGSTSLSNSLIDRDKYAELDKNVILPNDIKKENNFSKLASENATSTDQHIYAPNESNTRKKAREKDTENPSSLISNLEVRGDYNPIQDQMYEQLQHWVSAIQIWEDNQLTRTQPKICIPLKTGAKPVDQHSMGEKKLNYKGDVNRDGKPDGQGKVFFENGDWMCGEFKEGMRQGLGTMRTGFELGL